MATGEVFNKAKVKIGDQTFDRVYAFIFGDTAKLTAPDGTVVAEMSGPIEILNPTSESAEWVSGDKHWFLEKVNCNCGG